MVEVIKKYIKENISIVFISICFLFICFFNAFANIGLIEDGNHHFWEALICENVFLGHEGKAVFSYNSRYFPSLIQHLSVGIPVLASVTNIKTLLFVFTFVSYFVPVFLLFVVYINMPERKKNDFEIILLYFLTCMNFLIYQIWTENFVTGLFLWTVFVVYYYCDFANFSKMNSVSIVLFSLCLISSHPMTSVFVVPMIVFAIIKHFKTKNVPVTTSSILILSYIFLFAAFIFNLYFVIKPIYPKDDYLKFSFFKEPAFIYFLILTVFVLTVSLINDKKIKYIVAFIYVTFCFGLFYFVVLEINSCDGYMYRTLGFYVPLFLMSFISFKDFFKLKMNYKYMKITNVLLTLIFVFHCVYYGTAWNKYLLNVKDVMINKKTVNFIKISKFNLFHFHMLPYTFVFICPLFNVKSDCKIIVSKESFLYGHCKKIRKYKYKLAKFDVDVDKFVL